MAKCEESQMWSLTILRWSERWRRDWEWARSSD